MGLTVHEPLRQGATCHHEGTAKVTYTPGVSSMHFDGEESLERGACGVWSLIGDFSLTASGKQAEL